MVKNPPVMQGRPVPSLAEEDTSCLGATKPMRHDSSTCALPPDITTEAECLESVLCNKRNHRHEKPTHHNAE